MQIEFTGSETPAEIARAAIEWFSETPNPHNITIFYEDSVPKLRYEFQGGNAEYVCIYRLDKMLESFYEAAEQIFDENLRVGYVDAQQRSFLIPYIAFSGMTTMLSHLVVLLAQVYLETLGSTQMLTAGVVLHSLVKQSPKQASLGRAASKVIQGWIDIRVNDLMKKKREYFVGYMNTHPLLHIPTGVGRPRGSTKSEEQKAQDAAQTANEVEDAVRKLYETSGKRPTRTEVAQVLKPGINPKTGTDSRLSVFSKKIKKQGIDFDEIVSRVCGLPEN